MASQTTCLLWTVELASWRLILGQRQTMIPVKCDGHLPQLGQGKVTYDGTGAVTRGRQLPVVGEVT